MSKYIIAVFPSYEQAKKTIEHILNEGLSHEFTILNNLPKLSYEDFSPKLDGIISGVSDVFLGLPAFVNPMSAFGLPYQQNTYNYKEEKWAQFGIDRYKAMKYQELMAEGKYITAILADKSRKEILDILKFDGGNPPVEIINV